MSIPRTNWQDHSVEKPMTYTLTDNGDGTVTLVPEEGEIYRQGTPVNAENLNNIEDRLDFLNTFKLEKLWENPNPSSNFSSQTVTLSRSVAWGEMVIITHRRWETGNTAVPLIAFGGLSTRLRLNYENSNSNNGYRTATIGPGATATITSCTYNGSTQNGYAKPLAIYGFNPAYFKLPVQA